MIEIVLTESQISEALAFADAVENAHIARGDQSERLPKEKDEIYTSDQIGSIGEFAFSLLTGLPMDREIKVRDNGVDFVTPKGHTIDIKTNRRRYWKFNLLVKSTDSPADILIHSQLDGPAKVIFHGWARGADVVNWKRMASKFSQVAFNYYKEPSELLSMEEFLSRLEAQKRTYV